MHHLTISEKTTNDHSAQQALFKILRLKAVQDRTGLARSTIYAKMNAGEFVKNVKLGKKSVGWYEHEINEWIMKRRC